MFDSCVLGVDPGVSAMGLAAVARHGRRPTLVFAATVRTPSPINHRLAQRVRAHVLICMLAYHLEWHMRQALAPILFDDHDRSAAEAERRSVVAPARRSPAARRTLTKVTDDNQPVASLHDLLKNLSKIVRDTVRPKNTDLPAFTKITRPTDTQQRALDLLGDQL